MQDSSQNNTYKHIENLSELIMKKILRFPLLMAVSVVIGLSATSCSDSNNNGTEEDTKEVELAPVVKQYVNNTVITTYKSLADESIVLYNALVALKKDKTDANVKAAADSWIKARNYWELSEAFLFGPADDFGIDPHIDTWPLAKDALIAELKNKDHLAKMAQENGDIWVGETFEEGLFGFHGIEYILFEEGQAKSASKITDDELIYVVAVAGDLRNQCFRLEASWAGINNVTAEKKAKLIAMDAAITYGSGDDSKNNDTNYSYGECMLNPGLTAFSNSNVDACETILDGCQTIADEVGAMKIGKPHTGDDINYIESPYSYNSKIDFIGNIESIRNAYLGGADSKNRGASVADYVKKVDPSLHAGVIAAIDNAVAKITAIPFPFAKNYTSTQAGEAMVACNELADVLTKAKLTIRK